MNTNAVRSALITARAALPSNAGDLIDTINQGLLELEVGKDPFKIETAPPTLNDNRSHVFVCEDCQTQIAVNWMMINGKTSGTVTGKALQNWELTCPECGGRAMIQ